jgi:hypothetical protein
VLLRGQEAAPSRDQSFGRHYQSGRPRSIHPKAGGKSARPSKRADEFHQRSLHQCSLKGALAHAAAGPKDGGRTILTSRHGPNFAEAD